jgi:hypothetical protein
MLDFLGGDAPNLPQPPDNRPLRWAESERGRAHVKAKNEALRAAVLAHLGGKCRECGFSNPRALHVDHVKGDGFVQRQRMTWKRWYREILALADPSPIAQLLCANCNWLKRYDEGSVGGRKKLD